MNLLLSNTVKIGKVTIIHIKFAFLFAKRSEAMPF